MAPSRAFLRCVASVYRRPSPRLLSTSCRLSRSSCAPASPLTVRLSACTARTALQPGPSQRLPACARAYSQETSAPPEPPDHLSEGELHVFNKIKAELEPVQLEVQDISGGCGSMYALEIASPKFNGLTVIKQHKLVNSILADEIKSWHGVQLRTRAA